jgi:UDP-glucose 4-epimerase
MSKHNRILVTGGCGYIGSHVTRILSESGYPVVVFDNLSSGSSEALLNGERLIIGDLADEKHISTVISDFQIDTVFHFAASVVVSESVRQPLAYYENNTVNTIKLLRACVCHQVKNIIFSSTAAVYGETADPYVSEDTPTKPTSPYGRSKLMDEWILIDTARAHSLNYAILRYFNVAGAEPYNRLGQRVPDATHLIKVACEAALGKQKDITIFGDDYPTRDGTCIRDFIHVEDLAMAHVLCLEYLSQERGNLLVNCGYERGYTVAEVIAAVKRVSGSNFPVKTGPRRPGDIPSLIARTDILRRDLGWQPQFIDLDDIVRTSLAWEQKLSAARSDQ